MPQLPLVWREKQKNSGTAMERNQTTDGANAKKGIGKTTLCCMRSVTRADSTQKHMSTEICRHIYPDAIVCGPVCLLLLSRLALRFIFRSFHFHFGFIT